MCNHNDCVTIPVRVLPSREIKNKAVDRCIADMVLKLNGEGIQTWGSCCGHFKAQGEITIDEESVDRAIELGYNVVKEEMGWQCLWLVLV